jgi:hypothetical protein
MRRRRCLSSQHALHAALANGATPLGIYARKSQGIEYPYYVLTELVLHHISLVLLWPIFIPFLLFFCELSLFLV